MLSSSKLRLAELSKDWERIFFAQVNQNSLDFHFFIRDKKAQT